MRIVHTLSLLAINILAGSLSLAAPPTPGTVDEAFAITVLPDRDIYALAQQNDGKILVAGDFSKLGDQPRIRIARLESSGLLDPGFDPGGGPNRYIYAVLVQPDGQILVGGYFDSFAGTPRAYLARLNLDGSLDTSFYAGGGANNQVLALAQIPTGEIFIGGTFSAFGGDGNHGYLAMLKQNGDLSPNFTARLNGAVWAITLLADGKILVAGDFTAINGEVRNRLARLNADGSLDESFDPAGGPNSSVRTILPLPDGTFVIGGDFSTVNGGPWPYAARIKSNGLPDPSFVSTVGGAVYRLGLLDGGRILAGGSFSGSLARLRSDGSTDTTFAGGPSTGTVYDLAIMRDGNIVVAGNFSRLNGITRSFLARVQGQNLALGGEIEFANPDYQVSESQPSVSLEVRRKGNSASAVSVDYLTVNGTANAGDYTQQSGKLQFGAGEVSKTLTVPIRADLILEDDENFSVTLKNPSGGAVVGSQDKAIITILNDDQATTPGGILQGFGTGGLGGAAIYALAAAPDGKVVAGGDFREILNESRYNVTRFNADGTLDPGFNPSAWADGTINAVAVQNDGRIVLGGNFGRVNGVLHSYLARLNLDGTLDETFTPGSGPNQQVYAITPLASGDILVAGSFTSYSGDSSQDYFVKVFSDGTIDSTFKPQVNGGVYTIALQPDGKFLIGGDFTRAGGENRVRVARFNADGSIDLTFDPGGGPSSTVWAIGVLNDGKIAVGGAFATVNGGSWAYLARLAPNGLPDPTFNPSISSTVYAVAVYPDGRVLAGGSFPGGMVLLRADVSMDATFDIGIGANNAIRALLRQSDGNVVVGGTFTQFNGFTRSALARIQGNANSTGGEIEFSSPVWQTLESVSSAVLRVRRSGNTNGTVSVDFLTITGTANAGDYTPQSSKVTFAPGETEKTISIPIKNDLTAEDDEVFTVALKNPTGGASLGPQDSTFVWILNDDTSDKLGAMDPSFARGNGGGSGVSSLAITPDQKLVVGGDFRVIAGESHFNITRLNLDGSADPSFGQATWFNDSVAALAVMEDGRIIAGGNFGTVNGENLSYITRLNADGTLDQTFTPPARPNRYVSSILLLPGDDILVGGGFTAWGGDSTRYGLVKLFSDGTLDTTFSLGLNNAVYAIAQQSDGKILIGGDFTAVSGVTRNRIARLNSDGTLDLSFDPGTGPNSSVYAIAPAADNSVLIGGPFGSVNGAPISYLARLTRNGLPDFNFAHKIGTTVNAIAVQPDGKVFVGGNFAGGITRLRVDGSSDPTFTVGTGANAPVRTLALQLDGNIVAGGSFTQFDTYNRSWLARLTGLSGAAGGELEFSQEAVQVSESQASVTLEVRRNGNNSSAITVDFLTASETATAADFVGQNGKLIFASGEIKKAINIALRSDTLLEDDETFTVTLKNPTGGAVLGAQDTSRVTILNDDFPADPGTIDGHFGSGISGGGGISSSAIAPGGKIIIGGDFRTVGGQSRYNIARLNSDGSLDSSFNPAASANSTVYTVAADSSGRVLLGGQFGQVNNSGHAYLARFTADGNLDDTFNANLNNAAYILAVLPDDSVLAGGAFTIVNGDSTRPYFIKLLSDGSVDTTFNAQLNNNVQAIALAADRKIYIGGDFTTAGGQPRSRLARLNSDGTTDLSFDTGTGLNNTVTSVALQPDGKILIGGTFSTLNSNPHSYFARLLPSGAPDPDFSPAPNSYVRALALESDGTILAGGSFTAPGSYFARFNPDGTVNTNFLGLAANNAVSWITPDTRGGFIVTGNFTQFAGVPRTYLARINGQTAAGSARINSITLSGTAIRISISARAGPWILQSSPDLKAWSTLQNGSAGTPDFDLNDATDGSKRFYRLLLP